MFYSVKQGSLVKTSQDLTLASEGQDFVGVSAYRDAPDGSNSLTIPVQVLDDEIPEVEEVFLVQLTQVQLLTGANSTFRPKLGE